MNTYLLLVALLIGFTYCARDECSADYECGNPVYFNCGGQPCTILSGIGAARGQVFWAERCPTSGNATAVYVVRSDSSGVKRIITVPESSDGRTKAERLVNANAVTVYVGKTVPVYAAITGFSVTPTGYSSEFTAAYPRSAYDFKMAFDEVNNVTFGCWHPYYGVIIRYETLNITSSMSAKNVYTSIRCSALAYANDAIYWAESGPNTTTLFSGNPACVGCKPPTAFTTAPGTFSDFKVYNGRIYYAAVNQGVRSVALINPDWNNPQILVSSGSINALAVREGIVYYNDLSSIKAVSINGSSPSTISKPGSGPKKCACVGRFTGPDCTECRGQVQWEDSTVTCVPYNAVGFPSSCSADYMCGNMPFTNCNARKRCECAAGFTGAPRCDTCAGNVTWANSVPTCTP